MVAAHYRLVAVLLPFVHNSYSL